MTSLSQSAGFTASAPDDYAAAVDFLMSRINYERTPDLARGPNSFPLERMRVLLEHLGNPHESIPCVHIAGSKGKGSTATMLARMLEAGQYRVGLFTSPHAHRFEERFTVNGECAEEQRVVEIVQKLYDAARKMQEQPCGGPSFFELATAAGWMHFLSQQVDLAVIEVGLGGRLDSTNLCSPLVTVITSISKDHTRLLGSTEELIAREKAGIIKHQIPMVCGVQKAGPRQVIEGVALQHQAPLFQLGRDFKVDVAASTAQPGDWLPNTRFHYHDEHVDWRNLQLAMPGEHQANNAALAIKSLQLLRMHEFHVPAESLRSGLARAKIALRIDVRQQAPLVILDAAHNAASIAALCRTIGHLPMQRKTCIFAASRDKDTVELLRILDPHFDNFVLTAYQENPRAIPLTDLKRLAETILSRPFSCVDTPQAAVSSVLAAAKTDDLLCVTGSFFLAAEVDQWWKSRT